MLIISTVINISHVHHSSSNHLVPGQEVIHVSQYIGKGGPDGAAEVHLVGIQNCHSVSVRVVEIEIVLVVVGYTPSWNTTGSPPTHICTCRKRVLAKYDHNIYC